MEGVLELAVWAVCVGIVCSVIHADVLLIAVVCLLPQGCVPAFCYMGCDGFVVSTICSSDSLPCALLRISGMLVVLTVWILVACLHIPVHGGLACSMPVAKRCTRLQVGHT